MIWPSCAPNLKTIYNGDLEISLEVITDEHDPFRTKLQSLSVRHIWLLLSQSRYGIRAAKITTCLLAYKSRASMIQSPLGTFFAPKVLCMSAAECVRDGRVGGQLRSNKKSAGSTSHINGYRILIASAVRDGRCSYASTLLGRVLILCCDSRHVRGTSCETDPKRNKELPRVSAS
jgi:hypothetical protein